MYDLEAARAASLRTLKHSIEFPQSGAGFAPPRSTSLMPLDKDEEDLHGFFQNEFWVFTCSPEEAVAKAYRRSIPVAGIRCVCLERPTQDDVDSLVARCIGAKVIFILPDDFFESENACQVLGAIARSIKSVSRKFTACTWDGVPSSI